MAAKANAKGKETEEEAEVAEAPEGAEAAPPPKRKLSIKLMAMIGAGVVLVAAIGIGAYFIIGSVRQTHAAPVPVKPAAGVYVNEPFAFSTSVPLAGNAKRFAVSGSPSTSVSFVGTKIVVAGASSFTVAASSTATDGSSTQSTLTETVPVDPPFSV